MATKAQNLKYRYGITLERWQAMYDKQGGRCAICQRKAKLNVDHNHGCPNGCTGARSCGMCVRGLLCYDCNQILLGRITRETAKGSEHACGVLERAIMYLKWGIPEIEVESEALKESLRDSVDLEDSHAITSSHGE